VNPYTGSSNVMLIDGTGVARGLGLTSAMSDTGPW
jgi:hypothetical protein